MFGGIVSGSHDASVSVIDADGVIQFASASERFSRVKHCSVLTRSLLDRIEACRFKVFYEDLSSHPQPDLGSLSRDAWEQIAERERVDFLRSWRYSNPRHLSGIATHKSDHHRSHAAATFFTRPWEGWADTVILTIDGVGKDYMTANNIYRFDRRANSLVLIHSDTASLGTLYSAIAFYLKFDHFEEGSMMGLSSFGEPAYVELIEELYDYLYLGEAGNRYLQGGDWHLYGEAGAFLDRHLDLRGPWRREDLASSAQSFLQRKVLQYAEKAREYGSKLCYGGGVAQNVIANSLISELFDDMWIVSDPTDGGSSLGAAAWAYAAETGKDRVRWTDAFLGFEIQRPINPKEVVDHLLSKKICGIAHGAAEFGPRALGNRSLLGDARMDIKDIVNRIKKREPFRPFGAVVLEEEFDRWFTGKSNRYMQFVCKPKHDLDSVIHVDATSRVQTVPRDSRSCIRPVLEEYFDRTGIPLLLNTSLNIKGQPMVNDEHDAQEFERAYAVKVF